MQVLTATLVAMFLVQAAPPPSPPQPRPKQQQQPAPVPAPPRLKATAPVSEGLAVQVALDRAGFSPGAIDGSVGSGTKKALAAHRAANGGDPQPGEPTTRYTITEADAAGPYEPQIPSELPDQAKLPSLAYKNVLEALAERYHSTPALLQRLNPGATFAAGEEITVPNVEPMAIPQTPAKGEKPEPKADMKPDAKAAATADQKAGAKPAPGQRGAAPAAPKEAPAAKPDVVVTVTKSTSALAVTDAAGKTLMYAPVTTGSARDPLPIGEWKVNGVSLNPPFRYNPDLFWDADPTHEKALIKPGPNNPVGLVWIDISKEHYGLHGTPEPSTVGKTASHGCVRLTNWDALKLAGMVKPGTKVVFKP